MVVSAAAAAASAGQGLLVVAAALVARHQALLEALVARRILHSLIRCFRPAMGVELIMLM
jgi:hypothetical protein